MTKLRDYHNHVKSELYKEYITNTNNDLLDIGVGRGGDMHKWNKCNIQNVYGIDISKASIMDAISRFKKCDYLKQRNYRFYYTRKNESLKNIYNSRIKPSHSNKFDYISCMFTFHYFFENDNTLNQFFNDVNSFINTGGYLMITVPSGEKILELLKTNQTYQNNQVRIDLISKDIKYIGDAIDFYLTDTLYFGEKMISREYLVFEKTIKSKCKLFGFKIVKSCMFHEYIPPLLEDEDSKIASSINKIYVLQKC